MTGCHPLVVCSRIVVGGLGCRLAVVVVVPVQFVGVGVRFGLCRRGRTFVLPSCCQVMVAFFWRLPVVVRSCLLLLLVGGAFTGVGHCVWKSCVRLCIVGGPSPSELDLECLPIAVPTGLVFELFFVYLLRTEQQLLLWMLAWRSLSQGLSLQLLLLLLLFSQSLGK